MQLITHEIAVTRSEATFGVAQTAGNLNVVAVGWNDTVSTITSVTNTRGNTYVQAGSTVTGAAGPQAIYYAKNIAAGSNTVTVAFNQAAPFVDMRILEYSGLDLTSPLDVTAGAAGTGTAANSETATTTSANELIFGAGYTVSTYAGPGAGFIARIGNQRRDLQCNRAQPGEQFARMDHADGNFQGETVCSSAMSASGVVMLHPRR